MDRSPIQKHSQDMSTLRRAFSRLLIGGLLALPRIAIAQVSTAVRRIGILAIVPATPGMVRKLLGPLRKLGWIEGKNLRVERRYAGSLGGIQPVAEELARANVDVILADGPNPTLAAMRATTTIPIVFLAASDAVASGLVANLGRPKGNVTGLSVAMPELHEKLLSLFKELLPTFRRIGILQTLWNPQFDLLLGRLEHSCQSIGIEPVFVGISTAGEIETAIAQLARERVQAFLLFDDSFAGSHGPDIIGAALKRGLPTMTTEPNLVREDGALASYSPAEAEIFRRAAYYIDRILRGAKPADLPVEQPTQFEFVLNLKTARTLGLAVPQALLLRADEVVK